MASPLESGPGIISLGAAKYPPAAWMLPRRSASAHPRITAIAAWLAGFPVGVGAGTNPDPPPLGSGRAWTGLVGTLSCLPLSVLPPPPHAATAIPAATT